MIKFQHKTSLVQNFNFISAFFSCNTKTVDFRQNPSSLVNWMVWSSVHLHFIHTWDMQKNLICWAACTSTTEHVSAKSRGLHVTIKSGVTTGTQTTLQTLKTEPRHSSWHLLFQGSCSNSVVCLTVKATRLLFTFLCCALSLLLMHTFNVKHLVAKLSVTAVKSNNCICAPNQHFTWLWDLFFSLSCLVCKHVYVHQLGLFGKTNSHSEHDLEFKH